MWQESVVNPRALLKHPTLKEVVFGCRYVPDPDLKEDFEARDIRFSDPGYRYLVVSRL